MGCVLYTPEKGLKPRTAHPTGSRDRGSADTVTTKHTCMNQGNKKRRKASASPTSGIYTEKMLLEVRPKGANRSKYRSRPEKLSSWCGKEDILTRDCQCQKPGNAKTSGLTQSAAQSEKVTALTRKPLLGSK